MTQQVCRNYQSGTCRFGQACRYLHPRDNTGFGAGNVGGQLKLGEGFNLPTQESIKTDLTERPTWFLSSYAPGKDPPSQLIDGKDISPEEARVLAYKCRAEGNPGAYEAEWQRLTSEADAQIKNILNDLPGAVNFMKNAYENRASSRYNPNNAQSSSNFGNTISQSSPFGNTDQAVSTFGQSPQPTSAFGQSLQPTSAFGQASQPTSAFSQPQPTSVFTQPPQSTSAFSQPPQQTSVFGTASPFATRPAPAFGQSTFGQNTPAFGQSAFGSTVVSASQPQSTFGQPAFGQPSLPKPAFGQPAFGQPAFGQPAAIGQATSPFGAPTPVAQTPGFGQPPTQQQTSAFSQASPFGTPSIPKPTFGQSAFAQASPFGVLPQGQPQQNNPVNLPFGQVQSPNTNAAPNVFQQAAASSFSNPNSFQQGQQATVQQAQQTSAFGQPSQLISAFGQPTALASTFGTPQQNTSAFSNQNTFQGIHQVQQKSHQVNPQLREAQKAKKWDDPIIEYMQVETDAFTAATFTLGSVPTVAPSREMCWT